MKIKVLCIMHLNIILCLVLILRGVGQLAVGQLDVGQLAVGSYARISQYVLVNTC